MLSPVRCPGETRPLLGRGLDLTINGNGLAIGHFPRVNGIRINFRDRYLEEVNGLNLTFWSPPRNHQVGGSVRGLALGLTVPTADRLQGISLGGLAVVAHEELSGIGIGGLAVVSEGMVQGIAIGGLATVSIGRSTGINLGGLATVSEGPSTDLNIGGLATVTNGGTTGHQHWGAGHRLGGSVPAGSIGRPGGGGESGRRRDFRRGPGRRGG